MSAIEIAMHKSVPSATATPSSRPVRLSDRVADFAIRLAELIAGNERPADRRPELAGNPWARPIGLGTSR